MEESAALTLHKSIRSGALFWRRPTVNPSIKPHPPHWLLTTMDVSGGNAWIESYLDALVGFWKEREGRGAPRSLAFAAGAPRTESSFTHAAHPRGCAGRRSSS